MAVHTIKDYSKTHALPDFVHVLGQDVMHVLQVRSQELPLWFSRALLFLTKRHVERKRDILFPLWSVTAVQASGVITRATERREEGFILGRDNGRSGADVPGHIVQDLHGVLQFQLLVQRHDTGLSAVVSDQDLPQYSVVELHKPDTERERGWRWSGWTGPLAVWCFKYSIRFVFYATNSRRDKATGRN